MKRIGALTADSVAMLMVSIGYDPEYITEWIKRAVTDGESYPVGPVTQIRFTTVSQTFIMYVDTDEPIGDDDIPPEVIR